MYLRRSSMFRALLVGLALYVGSSCQASTPDTVSAPIGAAGGMVALTDGTAKGTSVMLPPGALQTMVDIKIGVATTPASDLPDGVSSMGPTIQLGPEGQTFAMPVTITIPAAAGADTLYTRRNGDTDWSQVMGASFDAASGVMTAEVSHFSQWVAAKGSSSRFTFRQVENAVLCPNAGPSVLAAADFNKDGKTDVAVGCGTGNQVSMMLGRGDGTFQAGALTPQGIRSTGEQVVQLLTGDWNGDGKIDLLRRTKFALTLITGKGDGQFNGDLVLANGFRDDIASVAVGDFTGDKKLDVAQAVTSQRNISLLPGAGNGTFETPLSLLTPLPLLYAAGSVASGDFNGDRNPDLAFSTTAQVGVLINSGCALNPPVYSAAPGLPTILVSADLNGDGKLDLVMGGSWVTAMLGKGDGTFLPATLVVENVVPRWIRSGDMDGDGKLDLVVGTGLEVMVLAGDGKGGFAKTRTSFTSPFPASDGLLVDMNNDQKLDIVLSVAPPLPTNCLFEDCSDNPTSPNSKINVFLNTLPRPVPPGPPPQPYFVTPASVVNNVGGPITIYVVETTNVTSITLGGVPCSSIYNSQSAFFTCVAPARPMVCGPQKLVMTNADGTFGTFVPIPGVNTNNTLVYQSSQFGFAAPTPLATGTGPDHVLAVDLNGDGKLDLANTNRSSNNVTVRLGNGDGTFGSSVSFPVGSTPIGMAAADMNGDGKLDLLTAEYGGGNSSVLLGDGKGGFPTILANPGSGGSAIGVATGDLNGDNKLDAIMTDSSNGSVSIMLGDGTGKLTFKSSIAVQAAPQEIAIADFNRDGKLDFVVTNNFTNSLSVALGNGDGTFGPRLDIPVQNQPLGLRLSDLNDDGNIDVVIANVGTNDVSVLLGNGLGGFAPITNYPVGMSPRDASIADFNSDQIPDLLVANNGAPNVSVLLGVGNGTFKAALVFPAGNSPAVAVTGDFNGDGLPDFVSTNILDNTLSVSLQQCK